MGGIDFGNTSICLLKHRRVVDVRRKWTFPAAAPRCRAKQFHAWDPFRRQAQTQTLEVVRIRIFDGPTSGQEGPRPGPGIRYLIVEPPHVLSFRWTFSIGSGRLGRARLGVWRLGLDDASGHKSTRLSIISALLKVFLFGIRTKLTDSWGN